MAAVQRAHSECFAQESTHLHTLAIVFGDVYGCVAWSEAAKMVRTAQRPCEVIRVAREGNWTLISDESGLVVDDLATYDTDGNGTADSDFRVGAGIIIVDIGNPGLGGREWPFSHFRGVKTG